MLPLAAFLAARPMGGEIRACRWCDVDARGHDRLNRVDRFWRDHVVAPTRAGRTAANRLSYFTLYATAGTSAFDPAFVGGGARRAGRNLLIAAEAVAVDAALTVAVKRIARRERPYAHFRDPAAPAQPQADDHQSFFSGHASLAFAWASAACQVRRYQRAGAGGAGCVAPYALASVTALLRNRADRHYLSDVLVGAAVGYALGRLAPALHDTRLAGEGPARAVSLPPFQIRFSW